MGSGGDVSTAETLVNMTNKILFFIILKAATINLDKKTL